MRKRKTYAAFRCWVLWVLALTLTVSASPGAGATGQETIPAEEVWQGFDVGAHLDEISFKIAIQIGDTGFNQLGFSQRQSDRYIATLSAFAAGRSPAG